MKFNMGSWRCGSSACALGTAALHLPFRLQGLELKNDKGGNTVVCFKDTKYPTFRGSYEVAQEFFGITSEESFSLFFPAYGQTPESQITPQMVAARVLTVIKKYAGIK
jgi:hypothetical protein